MEIIRLKCLSVCGRSVFGRTESLCRRRGFLVPLARLHLSDKLIDGFGEMLRVFPSDEISEVYYAGGVDAWDTVFC